MLTSLLSPHAAVSTDIVAPLILLEKAVGEKGAGYVQMGSCENYDARGASRCIVGHVLSYLGLGPTPWVQLRGSAGSTYDSSIRYMEAVLPVRLTPSALRALEVAQAYQDQKRSWGTAVAQARADFDLRRDL